MVGSGCEISIIHKDLVPVEKLKEVGSIYLQHLFGEEGKSPLVKLPLAIPQLGMQCNSSGNTLHGILILLNM